jgi:uncharacterized protein YecE (DUF72 family)
MGGRHTRRFVFAPQSPYAADAHPEAEERKRVPRGFLPCRSTRCGLRAASAPSLPVAPFLEVRRRSASRLPRIAPKDQQHAFEFRHDSWLTDGTYAALQEHGVALCLAESEKLVVPHVITAPFVYARLRKPDYTEEDRAAIAARAADILDNGRDLFVYFKHEESPQGAIYAEELYRAFNKS